MSLRAILLVGAALTAGELGFCLEHPFAANQQSTTTSKVGDGLRTITMDGPDGRVTVKLPDDVRTGDRITGTIVTEPKGNSTEEQANKRSAIRSRIIRLIMTRTSSSALATTRAVVTVPLSGESTTTVTASEKEGNSMRIEFTVSPQPELPIATSGIEELGRTMIPIDILPPATPVPTPKGSPASRPSGPASNDEMDYFPMSPTFEVPGLGQHGKPVQILGPFDGSGATTDIGLALPNRDSDLALDVVAESPRKAIVDNPLDLTGLGRITLKEGGSVTSAPFRNIAVALSAPKTRLEKGETTELRVQIAGLANISQPLPVTLTASGVITMSGGPYQSFLIGPSQISAGGTFATTRTITGIQAGGWSASVSVVARRFDVCLQDEADGRTRLLLSTLTGEYMFTGGSGLDLEGRGKVALKGCTVTLKDSSHGRRVEASVDLCSHSGTADVKLSSTSTLKLVDMNSTDNICLP